MIKKFYCQSSHRFEYTQNSGLKRKTWLYRRGNTWENFVWVPRGTVTSLPCPLISSSVSSSLKINSKKQRAHVASRDSVESSEIYKTKWDFLLFDYPSFLHDDTLVFKGFQVTREPLLVMLLAFYLKSLLKERSQRCSCKFSFKTFIVLAFIFSLWSISD